MIPYFDDVREEIEKLANSENLRPLEECKNIKEILRRGFQRLNSKGALFDVLNSWYFDKQGGS